ncbi:23S rRNA (cytidine(2498)-2'-O)-methyltransferase RlmM [Porticoccus sp. W117]|uniref:23S rRNA (cytidine(2498)-2'-O)-methyltransferase RlmM n=1 Tax=Porticoccus sp. W117 TaxID=3054777 RepID=UPI002599CE42|nr:23S rRNA (cytidine(2498)-2'-O)-methyltransferase RlmM [Porticoccus sp. W117]MDM3872630.1 23S rRNA (cytidine(2498)-2'-O)-methyltransferase RlmM [Porticoccus sp. W117]
MLDNTPNQIVLYCRAGFEKECAAEISDCAARVGVSGYVKARPDDGYVTYVCHQSGAALQVMERVAFEELMFARQWFAAAPMLDNLPPTDRVSALLESARALGPFDDLSVEHLDTNNGKEMSRLCRKISHPLRAALKKQGLLKASAKQQLHVLFLDGSCAFVGVSQQGNRSPWAMGVPRLKMPREAPSRATLKLDEAILWFLQGDRQHELMKAGTLAVDLGAAPGGWTWQLVRRGLYVDAVDNGPMDKVLMDSGMVAHVRGDAYTYQPKGNVSWLVCDIADKPARTADMVARWASKGWCRRAIFNLKLPMKQRYNAVQECREIIESGLAAAGLTAELRFKQLYHDREEVTGFLSIES